MIDQQDYEAGLVTLALQGLVGLTQTFAAEIGRRPSSDELVEIVGAGFATLPAALLRDIEPAQVLSLTALIKKGTECHLGWDGNNEPPSEVADLEGEIFAEASDALGHLCRAIAGVRGEAPTLKDVTKILTLALRKGDVDMLADISPAGISGLKASIARGRAASAKVGDVIGVPTASGQIALAVTLAEDRFGTAFGFFDGTFPADSVGASGPWSGHKAQRYPRYVENSAISSGRWRVLGHDDALRALFPAEPEIYHYPGSDLAPGPVGPYGSGETASGRLLDLTADEARDIGLTDQSYRQFEDAERLEQLLGLHSASEAL